jgi:chromosome segregation ATPase
LRRNPIWQGTCSASLRRCPRRADDGIVWRRKVATVEERLAYLEGRIEEQAQVTGSIRDAMSGMERRMDQRFDAIDRRFEAIDRRFEAIDRRFEAIDQRFLELEQKMDRRFEAVDRRFLEVEQQMTERFNAADARLEAFRHETALRFTAQDQRMTAIEDRISRQTAWLVGIQLTTFVAIVAAVLSR